MCVGIEDPTMRFFAHRSGGGLLAVASNLLVTARVETSLGLVVEVPVGTLTTLTNGTKWNKTPTQIMLASLLPLLPGEHTPIQLRFTAVGTSDWVIDDVFVDCPRLIDDGGFAGEKRFLKARRPRAVLSSAARDLR